MKTASFLNRIRAAHSLSNAMTDGVRPDLASLKAMGLPAEFANRFVR
ncbi:MAG: hypothetical protein AAF362_19880 [Pseudomonadota bacterium]